MFHSVLSADILDSFDALENKTAETSSVYILAGEDEQIDNKPTTKVNHVAYLKVRYEMERKNKEGKGEIKSADSRRL